MTFEEIVKELENLAACSFGPQFHDWVSSMLGVAKSMAGELDWLQEGVQSARRYADLQMNRAAEDHAAIARMQKLAAWLDGHPGEGMPEARKRFLTFASAAAGSAGAKEVNQAIAVMLQDLGLADQQEITEPSPKPSGPIEKIREAVAWLQDNPT